jgi:hypothetical protein
MRSASIGLFTSLFLAAGISGAAAQAESGPRVAPSPGRIAVTPHVGTDVTIGGIMAESATARITFTDNFAGIAFDNPGFVRTRTLQFNDLYGAVSDVGVGFAYGVSDRGELFGNFRYLHAAGKRTAVGNISVTGSVGGTGYAAGAALIATPSNFSSGAIEAGYRHFIPTGGPLLPYFSGMLGVNRTGSIDAQLFVDGGANGELKAGRVKVYNLSTSAAAGFNVGVTYAMAPQAALGFETGVRYDGKLNGDDSDLGRGGDGGLAGLNNSGNRWSIPLRLTGRFAF